MEVIKAICLTRGENSTFNKWDQIGIKYLKNLHQHCDRCQYQLLTLNPLEIALKALVITK
jgi:hypothetical protein